MAENAMEMTGFTIISNAGMAKSLVMEALYAAKKGEYELAEQKLNESQNFFLISHKKHSTLIQREANGESLPFSLLFMHAEDQLMSAETTYELVKEMITMYKRIDIMEKGSVSR